MPSKKTKNPAKALKKKAVKKNPANVLKPKAVEKTAEPKALQGPVSKEMTFAELINIYPAAVPILIGYGLHCIGCHSSALETIEQGALAHGLTPNEVEKMIGEINDSVKKQ